MGDIAKIHSEVYDLLIQERTTNPGLNFTFRKSNRESRLEKGYWFYGNEWYLAISFWTGMDWKNKTPNIIFVISTASTETYLEVNTSDSDEKRKFAVQYLVKPLGLEIIGQRYRKYYKTENSYLASLKSFLDNDKILIDRIIEENAQSFFDTADPGIGFIANADFEEQKSKVDKYKAAFKQEGRDQSSMGGNEKPIKIREVEIQNYGPIKQVEILDIPFSSQWIFFTGENGTGKTSILRALATAFCYRKTNLDEVPMDTAFRIKLSLYTAESNWVPFERIKNNNTEGSNSPLISGFAAYGQSRLKTNHSGLSSEVLKNISHESLFSSLFNDDSYLIDLQTQFFRWKNDNDSSVYYDNRKEYITEILTDILPNLYNIIFDDMIGDTPATSYIERDNDGGEFKKVTFNKLASGLKSMVAMIGDILVRLYEQQPSVFDPSEFTGIVLIDEIDIHLHPKLQKLLVEQLTRTFPKIQFIVSTHSPIPFLGAPKNSQIFKVERHSEPGVQIKRLDQQLILGDLLPNTILTSPIFGLDDIVPNSHDPNHLVRTETNYQKVEFNDQVKKEINEFLSDEKEQHLINLFKSRRQ
jgi:predicted ATPase